MRIFSNVVGTVCRLCTFSAATAIFSLATLIVVEIIARGVFNNSLLIVEEVAGYLVSASIFWALAPTFRNGAMIKLTILTDHIKSEHSKVIEILMSLLAITLISFWAKYVLRSMITFYDRETTSNGVIPFHLWIPELFSLIGIIALILVLAEKIFENLKNIKNGDGHGA